MKKRWLRYLALMLVLILSVGMLAACGDDDDDDDDDSGKKKDPDYTVNEVLPVSEDMVPVGYWNWHDPGLNLSCWYPGAATPGLRGSEYFTFEDYGKYKIYVAPKSTKKISSLEDAVNGAVKFVGRIDENMDDEGDFGDVKAGKAEKITIGGKTLYKTEITYTADGAEKKSDAFLEMYEDVYVIYFANETEKGSAAQPMELIATTIRPSDNAYEGIEGNSLGVPTPTPEGPVPTDEPGNPTPTPADEPTDTPTPTPEPEETPTPTLTEAVAAGTENYVCEDYNFSIDFPADAYVEEFEGGFYAETDDGILYIEYVLDYDDGVVENYDDFWNGVVLTPVDLYSILYLEKATYVAADDAKTFTVNGAKTYSGKLKDMVWDSDEEFGRGAGQFYVYECKESFGVFVGWYLIDGSQYDNFTEQQKALAEEYDKCMRSLKQTGPQIISTVKMYEGKLPAGDKFTFLYTDGDFATVEEDANNNALRFWFNEAAEGYVQVSLVRPKMTLEKYFETLKNYFDSSVYHFSDLESYPGRLPYQHSTVTYTIDEVDYRDEIYLSMDDMDDGDQELWFVEIYGTKDSVEEHEDFIDEVLWSLHGVN
ncbi:MAG: hypothetical protein K6B39_04905 [Lachnospiraceae bacterium]|nr:hypothetical protein [Lachnospiraceae bacterium]